MILDAVADPTTGVFAVGAETPRAEPMRAVPGPGIMAGLLGERRLIHTATRQQRRHADRLRQKAKPNR